jgi:hypothetical protein
MERPRKEKVKSGREAEKREKRAKQRKKKKGRVRERK